MAVIRMMILMMMLMMEGVMMESIMDYLRTRPDLSQVRYFYQFDVCMIAILQNCIPKSVRELLVESTWNEKLHPHYQSVRHQFDGSSSSLTYFSYFVFYVTKLGYISPPASNCANNF